MTKEEWLAIKPGDHVIDGKYGNADQREVLTVKRVTGKPGQKPGAVKTTIGLASYRSTKPVPYHNSDDMGGTRFQLIPSELLPARES